VGFRISKAIISTSITEVVEGKEEQTIWGIRLSSEYDSLLRLTKSTSNPKIFLVAVSRCLDFFGLLFILCTSPRSGPRFSMFGLLCSGTLVAKSYPVILFIPTSMSALGSPRSLSRTQPPVNRKTKWSPSGLPLSISCATSARILLISASSCVRVKVGGVVRTAGNSIVLYFFEMVVGGVDVASVVVIGVGRLRF